MPTVAATAEPGAPGLLGRVRDKIRLKHYSIRTEQAYVDWTRRFILFHGKRHPAALDAADVEAFLTDLAVSRRVAAATQNQAKSAILFLYREVIGRELPWLEHVERARTPTRVPVVLTRDEVACVLRRLAGVYRLLGRLLYGSGMQIMEGVRLRIKDVDFSRRQIVVRDGKGGKDRTTMLPASVAPKLRAHHVSPADRLSPDPRSGATRRHHLSDQSFQRAMRQAVRDSGIARRATPHTLRHSFATHLVNRSGRGVISPLDREPP